MSYIRKKKFGDRVYYYRVEGHRDENGKVRQRVIEYLGKSPSKIELPIDPKVAGQLAQVLMSSEQSESELKETLKKLGVQMSPGKIKEVSITYKPPLGKFVLRIE